MDIAQASPNIEEPASENPGEFASGSPNALRSGALRLMGWLFRSPYFPAGLIWLLVILMASSTASELLVQPASYWVNPDTSAYYTFLGVPLKLGLWAISTYIGYILVVILLLSFLNIKPAFVLWIGLCMFHLEDLVHACSCTTFHFFPFENPGNCATVYTISYVLAGILWSFLIWVSIHLGLVSFIEFTPSETVKSTWNKSLGRAGAVWLLICALAVIGTAAFAPKPVWRTIQTAYAPMGRTEASLVYDTKRSVAVLFGGTFKWTPAGGWEALNDTWEWNGLDWTQLQPKHSPSPRYGTAMAFDEKRGVTVLFGGLMENSAYEKIFFGDTWEWNGQDWQEISPPTSPSARQDQTIYFDPLRGTVVMYGGYYIDPTSQANIFLDDAWEWNGENWQEIPFDEPRRNSASAMIYDPIRQLPLLMDVEGLWVWQETHWTQPSFPASPPGRWGAQMTYNPNIGKILLFGGMKDKDVFDDTWIYDGQSWQQVITKEKPPRRSGHNMFYDQTRDTVVVFGGLDNGIFYNDMWEMVLP